MGEFEMPTGWCQIPLFEEINMRRINIFQLVEKNFLYENLRLAEFLEPVKTESLHSLIRILLNTRTTSSMLTCSKTNHLCCACSSVK